MTPFSTIPLDAIYQYRKAMEQANKGKYELSLKYLSNAITLAPQFTLALSEMGLCYERLGRYPEAVSKFDKVLKINQSNLEAEINRKRILEKMELTR